MKKRYCAMLLFAGHSVVAGSLSNVGNIHLKGYIGDRLDAMISHQIVERDIDYITAPFAEKTERTERWQSEFWGKYMHAAMPYLVYTGSEKLGELVDRGVDSILASQEQSGYIGNYPDELRCGEGWDVWGMKYTMLGLIHYYDYMTRQKSADSREKASKAIAACRRLCDYVIAELGPNGKRGVELWKTGYWSGFASSSILEPVVWLYNRTDDRKYFTRAFSGVLLWFVESFDSRTKSIPEYEFPDNEDSNGKKVRKILLVNPVPLDMQMKGTQDKAGTAGAAGIDKILQAESRKETTISPGDMIYGMEVANLSRLLNSFIS